MQKHFETLRESRKMILKIIAQLSIEQLNKIPQGFHNNICWNVTHLLVSQQLLCYKLSGLESELSEDLIENFKKGSAPTFTMSSSAFDEVCTKFMGFVDTLELDYNRGHFQSYNAYTTSVNVTLNTIEDAIVFNTYHEGIHLGIILQLLKLV